MEDLAKLFPIVSAEVEAAGLALVRLAWVTGEGDEPTLQVMAERPETRQLSISDCASLSHRLSDRFDALDPIQHAYRLEVSSPGIDRPLTRLSDFRDWIGHEAKIELLEAQDGQKRFRGELAGVEEEEILLTDRHGKKHRVGFSDIDHAKLVLTDRLIAATAPLDTSGADEYEDETPEEEEQD